MLTNEHQIDYNSYNTFYWYRNIRYDNMKNAIIDLTKMSFWIDSKISYNIFLNQYFSLHITQIARSEPFLHSVISLTDSTVIVWVLKYRVVCLDVCVCEYVCVCLCVFVCLCVRASIPKLLGRFQWNFPKLSPICLVVRVCISPH